MKRMTFKQTNFSNKVNIRCIHTAFHDSLFILCCFLYHIKVTSLRDSNLLQWTETFKKFDIGGGLSCSHFWVEGLFTTLFLLLHSLLRNRKTLRTLESGHYPIRKWSLSVLYYWHNLILELQRINTKLFCQSGCCCGSERPPTNQQHQPDLVRSSERRSNFWPSLEESWFSRLLRQKVKTLELCYLLLLHLMECSVMITSWGVIMSRTSQVLNISDNHFLARRQKLLKFRLSTKDLGKCNCKISSFPNFL